MATKKSCEDPVTYLQISLSIGSLIDNLVNVLANVVSTIISALWLLRAGLYTRTEFSQTNNNQENGNGIETRVRSTTYFVSLKVQHVCPFTGFILDELFPNPARQRKINTGVITYLISENERKRPIYIYSSPKLLSEHLTSALVCFRRNA